MINESTRARCGVCGAEVTADSLDPPTFSVQEGRPMLNKPIRVDPETGAVCWCQPARTEPTRED